MSTPWQGDAVSLVEAFRSGERSPAEELEATIEAIGASDLNAFPFLDLDAARERAATADVGQPFGGVPIGLKELAPVEGWPYSEASLVFADRVAEFTGTHEVRLMDAGAVPVGQTSASEFGGLNVSITKLHGVTNNPWQHGRTAGGSSSGSAAAVAGGLVTIASGGDGGGSIRIPAGFNGLVEPSRSPHRAADTDLLIVPDIPNVSGSLLETRLEPVLSRLSAELQRSLAPTSSGNPCPRAALPRRSFAPPGRPGRDRRVRCDGRWRLR